jgi:DNA-binding response OmpR family regulator
LEVGQVSEAAERVPAGRRILFVDDEPKIVSFVARALAAHGFAVDRAYTGTTGLQLARSGAYDVVILDLLLPDLDGSSVLRETMVAQPHQPVLVLSALTAVESKVRCLELGASDYLAKPFALAELIARIRSLLRQRASFVPEERFLRTGRVTLELLRRVADAGDGPVSLSEREFLLLRYLMSHPGQVCSREELLGDVWGYWFDPGTNVVDVYVGRLRAKLGGDLIETVRNVGYVFPAA